MTHTNRHWTPEEQKLVWNKAPFIDITRPELGKLDTCRACIKEKYYGDRDSDYGWEIDHIIPEKILKAAGVPQDLIDHIDNLRPMHWKNNLDKSDYFPKYPATVSAAGNINLSVIHRDYRINRDQINILYYLYKDYLELEIPSILGKWQIMVDREIASNDKFPISYFDDIVTPSIHDLD